MPSPSPSYAGRMAPYIPCSRCPKKWLVPQSVRWGREALDESVARARAAGWVMEEYKPCYCPECIDQTVKGDL